MINVGDKYIIELETVYGEHASVTGTNIKSVPDPLWRVKGFRSLVFDAEGLKKLVPLDQMRPSWWDEAYKKGLDEAWEAAKKIVDAYSVGVGIRLAFDGAFWPYFNNGKRLSAVFQSLSPAEALAKIREYEERKKAEEEEIKVGDEVTWASDPTHLVVVSLVEGKGAAVLASGKSHWVNEKDLHKTGRHFPEIAAVLEQMKGEQS